MTAKKDLKKRVRARQAHTGESYTAALSQVVAQRPDAGPSLVVELADLTEDAVRIGLHVRRAHALPPLIDHVDGASALRQLRDALQATEGDEDTALLRQVLLAGERPKVAHELLIRSIGHLRRFVARARAGIGGPNELGTMLALHIQGRRDRLLVVYSLRVAPHPMPEYFTGRLADRYPALFLATPDSLLAREGVVAWL